MSTLDPTEVFRQEASELFETLEGALLDLGQRPDDKELIDSAFRALHTIKGSGAMFGFDKVASFTHEFETAFELVRKEVPNARLRIFGGTPARVNKSPAPILISPRAFGRRLRLCGLV